MSTPESKLETAVANVATEIAKVKAWYQQYTLYVGLVVGLIVGAVVGHKL